ncbi:bacteriohemerythrin [Rhodoferax antarcticus]|uniref:Hemerythrin-like metal-binding domain protein n=1 Tax=Rhodoferax antarcticus ANT.BR TaxID=1111071 RepID=A0A1Q8YFB3_9BURK|nr:bacteriohemerythrin [Rhodoferax antarcticus]APW46452.1 hypothetical protein RA876_08780 [Rhodoferax antarcticus]MCW2312447.1 hemerythrin [Rhodoferax antarcticus]OLP06716.1 hemerythrin-like metal-binding domain protein [Rhodoferax antarcticus ANT.BR]
MTTQWKDTYKIGDTEIDNQHQELFRKINTFLEAQGKTELVASAMGLYKYTREHFGHEEQLMQRVGYPGLVPHVEQHNDLVNRLNEISQSIANETLVTADLEKFLTDWLLTHIRSSDTKLAAYVKLHAGD